MLVMKDSKRWWMLRAWGARSRVQRENSGSRSKKKKDSRVSSHQRERSSMPSCCIVFGPGVSLCVKDVPTVSSNANAVNMSTPTARITLRGVNELVLPPLLARACCLRKSVKLATRDRMIDWIRAPQTVDFEYAGASIRLRALCSRFVPKANIGGTLCRRQCTSPDIASDYSPKVHKGAIAYRLLPAPFIDCPDSIDAHGRDLIRSDPDERQDLAIRSNMRLIVRVSPPILIDVPQDPRPTPWYRPVRRRYVREFVNVSTIEDSQDE